jgi:amidase
VGLKPTRARTSIGPALGEGWGGLEVEHIVSRSVRDTAAMLDATAGPALGDPYWAPPQPKSYLSSSRTVPKKLRIAQILTRADGTDLHPDCIAAVEHAGKICQGLGHRIDIVDPVKAWQMDAERFHGFAQSYFALYATSLVTQIDDIIAQTRAKPSPKKLEGYTLALYEAGKAVTGVQYQQALNTMHALGRDMALWHQTYDVAIMPTLGTPPLKLGVINPLSADIAATFGKMVELSPFAAMQNSTGQPAISLPLYESADGLPIGVQFVGRMGDEELLLKLARSIEKAAPWKDRHPSIWD